MAVSTKRKPVRVGYYKYMNSFEILDKRLQGSETCSLQQQVEVILFAVLDKQQNLRNRVRFTDAQTHRPSVAH